MASHIDSLLAQLFSTEESERIQALDAIRVHQYPELIPILITELKNSQPIVKDKNDKEDYLAAQWGYGTWSGVHYRDVAKRALVAIGEQAVPALLDEIRKKPTHLHRENIALLYHAQTIPDLIVLVDHYRIMLFKNNYCETVRTLIEKHDANAMQVADLVPRMLEIIASKPQQKYPEFLIHLKKYADETALPILVANYRASLSVTIKPIFADDAYHQDLRELITRLGTQRDVFNATFPPLRRWLTRVWFHTLPWMIGGIVLGILFFIVRYFGIGGLCLATLGTIFLVLTVSTMASIFHKSPLYNSRNQHQRCYSNKRKHQQIKSNQHNLRSHFFLEENNDQSSKKK